MTDSRSSENASYREARSAFENLDTKDKVAFVLEATFGMLGRAAEEGGRALSDMLNDLSAEASRHRQKAEGSGRSDDAAASPPPAGGTSPGEPPPSAP